MFSLTHNTAVTDVQCTITWYSFFRDDLCTIPLNHPSIGNGQAFSDGHNIRIERGVAFGKFNVYVKAITRGLVTACSLPIPIEVCGHEEVYR
jgi:hypothetical protein